MDLLGVVELEPHADGLDRGGGPGHRDEGPGFVNRDRGAHVSQPEVDDLPEVPALLPGGGVVRDEPLGER